VKRIATPLNTSHLVPNDATLLRCSTALELAHAGDYKRALEVMRPLWPDIHQRPQTNALHPSVIAELYLCVATLIRQTKKTDQDEGLRTLSRSLLSESSAYYEANSDRQKLAACQIEFGYSYLFANEFEKARTELKKAVENLKTNGKTKGKALLALAELEYTTGKYQRAFKLLNDSATLITKTADRIVSATYHYQIALVLEKRASLENQTNLLHQAASHLQTANNGFRLSKDIPFRIDLEIKFANILHLTKRSPASHEQLNKARRLATSIRDKSRAARVDQIQAGLLINDKKYLQSEALSRKAAHLFTKAGRPADAAASLTLQATALAHLKKTKRAHHLFQQAFEIAQQAGATVEAAIAALSMTETLHELPSTELRAAYTQARENLSGSNDQTLLIRLLESADKVIKQQGSETLSETSEPATRPSQSLKAEVLAFERQKIQEALSRTNGKVTPAAKLLKITYQSLSYIINTRHQELLAERSPVKHRGPRNSKTSAQASGLATNNGS
jgi:hypothetical protein